MDQNKPIPNNAPEGSEGELAQNPAVDEFLSRLNYGMRRPKPGQEAISAALDAIQRLAVEMDSEGADAAEAADNACISCGASNRPENRFCSSCGVSLHPAKPSPHPGSIVHQPETIAPPELPNPALPPGPHHYHHHYHHHLFTNGGPPSTARGDVGPSRESVRARAPLNGQAYSRAEAAVRTLTQDWALACNSKQLDDLVELYLTDAVVLRPNVPAVRGTPAIREFFFTVLDSGFGEVELEPLRVEMFSDVAYEAGRCKSLVPVAMGKRREERGKYLVISTRHNGEWKITADSWSSDLSLAEPVLAPTKPPRRNP